MVRRTLKNRAKLTNHYSILVTYVKNYFKWFGCLRIASGGFASEGRSTVDSPDRVGIPEKSRGAQTALRSGQAPATERTEFRGGEMGGANQIDSIPIMAASAIVPCVLEVWGERHRVKPRTL